LIIDLFFLGFGLIGFTGSSKKNSAALLDSDDTASISSTSSVRSDLVPVGVAADLQKDSLLDQSLDALYEKR